MSLRAGEKLFNRYIIHGKIGDGAFGTVYRAYDESLNQYAVKFEKSYRGFLAAEKRVYEELQSYSQSSSAYHFSRVHYFGNHNGHDVMVLDLFGKTLRQVLREKVQLSLTECRKIAKQAIVQLEIMHRAGWVHGDLKPANIMMSGQREENLHIIDFGLAAKYCDDSGVHYTAVTDAFIGTAQYASIHVLSGLRCTRRDDLESLGYILIELCFGLPWSHIRGSTKEVRNAILSEKILHSPGSISPGFNSIVLFFDNVRSLVFAEQPDYEYLKSCFDVV